MTCSSVASPQSKPPSVTASQKTNPFFMMMGNTCFAASKGMRGRGCQNLGLTFFLSAWTLPFCPPDSCSPGYDYLIRKVLSEAFESRVASFAPISYLKNEYQFESSSEIEACRFALTVAFYAATYGSGDEANDKDYGCPGGFDGERIETMEDLFLLAVFQMYTRFLLPDEE